MDLHLHELASRYQLRFTRYADDVVFSGTNEFPVGLPDAVAELFENSPWTLAAEKTNFAKLPARLKVHGMLVHGPKLRLTRGYRNKLRAFQHVLAKGLVHEADQPRLRGHLNYSAMVARAAETP